MGTDQFRNMQSLRRVHRQAAGAAPEELRRTPEAEMLAAAADDKVYNIIHMIYRAKVYEGASKDYEFSAARWKSTGRRATAT
jgi:NTE family protein